MPNSHARISASSANRWIPCPGSVALCERLDGRQPDTSYAEEGSIAHRLAELKLNTLIGIPTTNDEWEEVRSSEYYTGEMEEATNIYRDYVAEVLRGAGKGAELSIEQTVSLATWIPDGYGTADAIIIDYDHHRLHVIDLKYGRGVKVNARGNAQLRLYAAGAKALVAPLMDRIDIIDATIVQPRLDHLDIESITPEDLDIWLERDVAPKAYLASIGSAIRSAGDWCRFCPARDVCRTRAETYLDIEYNHRGKPPEVLTDGELSCILERADEIKAWVNGIQDYALKRALSGKPPQGWTITSGHARRTYVDEDAAVDRLRAAGVPDSEIYQRKLTAITKLEAKIGKAAFSRIVGDAVAKTPGAPRLIRSTSTNSTNAND